MQVGSTEFYEMVKDFEMMAKKNSRRTRFDKEVVAEFEKPKFTQFYQCGLMQFAFEMFCNGYASGRRVYMDGAA